MFEAVIGAFATIAVALIGYYGQRIEKRTKGIDYQVNNRPHDLPTVSDQIDRIADTVDRIDRRQLNLESRVQQMEARVWND